MTCEEISIRIVRSAEFSNDARWNYRSIIRPYNTMYFVLGGDGHIRAGETVTDLLRGHVYLIPAGLLHDCWCDTFIHKLYVDVHVETLPGWDIFSDCKHILENQIPIETIEAMIRTNQPDYKNRLYFRAELERAIAEVLYGSQEPLSPKMRRFRPMLEDIMHNLSDGLRRESLAKKYGWNPSALSRAFRQAFGCGIKRYIERMIMSRLKEELILGDKNLKQLASEYRFSDEYYLSAFFKRNGGVAPSKYRNENVIRKIEI